MKVNIEIERAAKTLDQRHGAAVGRLPGEPCLLDQMRGDRAVDNTQRLPHDLWVAGKQKPQRERHTEYPLSHGLMGRNRSF